MKILRIEVERVVRPLQASDRHKDRIREELLAHLSRLFDNELARSGDEQIAATEAIRRFGDAPTLTRELQAGIPLLERWAFFSFPYRGPFRRRLGESPARYIVRTGCWGGALSMAVLALIALMCVILGSMRPHRIDQPDNAHLLLLLFGSGAIQCVATIGIGLLSERSGQELENRAAATTAGKRRRATGRVISYAVVSSLLLGASIAAVMLLIEACLPISLITRAQFWWITFGTAILGLPFCLCLSWSWRVSTRRFDNWDSLDLSENQPT